MDNKLYVDNLLIILMKTIEHVFHEEDNNELIIDEEIFNKLKKVVHECIIKK